MLTCMVTIPATGYRQTCYFQIGAIDSSSETPPPSQDRQDEVPAQQSVLDPREQTTVLLSARLVGERPTADVYAPGPPAFKSTNVAPVPNYRS